MKSLILIIFFFIGYTSYAQHEHHTPPKKQEVKPAPQKKPVKKSPAKKTATKKAVTKKPAPPKKPTTKVNTETHLHHTDTTAVDHSQHNMQDTGVHANHAKTDTATHNNMQHNMRDTGTVDHSQHNMSDMSTHGAHDMDMPMNHMYSLSLPMNRNASGTAWNPDNTPMYMYMKHGENSMWMFHGAAFLRYNTQELNGSTSRSASKFDAPNWAMAMYSRKVGTNGLFGFSAMLSVDALTVGKNGYPLLYQSGETYKGKLIVDRQHPHDLFSELAISYSHRISSNIDVFGYLGYPGEPALSAPAFMHRISAMNDPDAPLGHHWQDATHITFGVGTLGVRLGKFKLEGSSFTGREPNENRYNFDKPLFDSYSYRVSFNPSNAWALQFSQGFINSPEALHPDEDVKRTTASALYATPVKNDRFFAAAFIWGLNDAGDHHKEHSFLAEATQQFAKQALYGRYEFIQKSADELDIEDIVGHGVFDLHKLSIGTNRKIFERYNTAVTLGGHLSLNVSAKPLHNLYGKTPMAAEIYLQIRPKLFSQNK
jgi:hypothetical protein